MVAGLAVEPWKASLPILVLTLCLEKDFHRRRETGKAYKMNLYPVNGVADVVTTI